MPRSTAVGNVTAVALENRESYRIFAEHRGFTATQNYVRARYNPSVCGIIADEAANSVSFTYNELVNTGQCGIGIANGTNQLVGHNKVFENDQISGGGNTAIYLWKDSEACGPVTLANNIAVFKQTNALTSRSGTAVETKSGNTWDAAAWKILYPPSTTMPRSLIPSQPKNCVAQSPYSTQRGWPGC